eukprot:scaffold164929_cov31-Tisochrysis_lutea.AAC.1
MIGRHGPWSMRWGHHAPPPYLSRPPSLSFEGENHPPPCAAFWHAGGTHLNCQDSLLESLARIARPGPRWPAHRSLGPMPPHLSPGPPDP